MATKQEFELLYKIKTIADIDDVRHNIDLLRKVFDDIQVNPKLKTTFKDIFTDLINQVDKAEKQINAGIFDQKSLNSFKTNLNGIIGLFNQLHASSKNIKLEDFAHSFTADPDAIKDFTNEIDNARNAQQRLIQESLQKGSALQTAYNTAKEAAQKLTDANGETIKKTKQLGSSWKEFIDSLNNGKLDEARKQLNYIKRSLELNSNTQKNATTYYNAIEQAFNSLVKSCEEWNITIDENTQKIQSAAEPTAGYTQALEDLRGVIQIFPELLSSFGQGIENESKGAINASKNVEALISRFEQFFSLTNAFNLLRRTISSSFNTVKELDAAMTETATVTEYSVGQMWDKLDEYTSIANKLGATTLGTYKTITLFFQQGLDEQQSLALATETMKMARVAGIDYAEATQYMTSALRGFNMELNETSATRVNDVYSELAKITAADTNQIAIAMSKVASLANSANMELETTSAILSQIIETTQEAPETAGTALKTIIARFAEVKKLYSQGELTGNDENGEEIDVNKVSIALRKAGINLNDFITGNKGLDDIFLELSKKWGDLDLVTQRYIATMAAGSRQQSRFIAMMQDYDRLIELTHAAYNSAGSGEEQFEKTLDSLAAKLNELKNAWDSFTMSIANSDLLKAAVDGLKGLLTIINQISDAFGKASGMVKLLFAAGFAKLATTFTQPIFQSMRDAIRSGDNILTAASQGVGEGVSRVGNIFKGLKKSTSNGNEDVNNLVYLPGVKEQSEATSALGDQAKIASTKVLGFGAAMSAVGKIAYSFSDKVKDTNPVLSKWTGILGDAVSSTGSLAMVMGSLGNIVPQLGAALSKLPLGWIGVIITGVTAAFSYFRAEYEKSQQAIENFYDSSKKLTDQISEVYSITSDMSNTYDSLEECKKGTLDWYVQLSKLKDLYDQLIALNPDLKDFVTFNEETGFFTFDKEGFADWSGKQREYTAKTDRYKELRDVSSFYLTDDETIPGAYNAGYNIKQEDFTKLYGSYLTPEDYINILAQTNKEANNTENIYSRDEILSKMETIFGKSDDTWYGMTLDELKSLYLDMYLDHLAQSLREEQDPNLINRLGDKAGQNLSQIYGNPDKLLEQQQEAIIDNETANALKTYWESMDQLTDAVEQEKIAFNGLALEVSGALKYFNKLNEVIKENKDLLLEGTKDSTEYQIALGKITNEANNLFGGQLDTSFIEQYKEEFVDAFVNGSDEAFDYIQQRAIESFDIAKFLELGDYGFDDTIFNEVSNAIAIIKEQLESEEFVMTGQADFTNVYTALMAATGMTEEAAAQIASNLLQAFAIEAYVEQSEDGKTVRIRGANTGRFNAANLRSGGGGGGRSSGGGGSSKKEKPWENPYDQLYNLTERNEEAIRRRNILEKQYNAILRDREGTSTQLLRNSLQELANLQEQLSYQRQLQRGRKAQLDAVNSEMYMDSEGTRKSYSAWGVTKYANYNQQTNAIEIDWDAIDRVTDEQTGKAIEDYVKRLEELQKQFEQVDSDILDIEEEIDEINQRGKGEYLDFEQKVYDAIVQTYQDVIDSFSSLNDTINDSNEKILDDLQEQIDLERQIRDNTKEEEEIGSKEARLAYLQRDTSGANATEILRLQEEIADARQNYTDKLIDQKLTQLSKDNDDAAEQRQMQITLMQEQLDYWAQNGVFWNQVNKLLFEALDKDGRLKNNTQLVELLKETEGFIGMSTFSKENWEDDLAKNFIEAMQGYGSWMIEQAEKKGSITQDGNTYKYDKDKKVWMMGNEAYSAVYNTAAGRYEFTRVKDKDVQVGTIGSGNQTSGGGGYNPGGNGSGGNTANKGGGEELDWSSHRVDSYKVSYNGWTYYAEQAGSKDTALSWAANAYKKQYGFTDANFPLATFKQKATATKYAKGGFADFTGFAWLDGTKTNPEAVLSAKQTEMFISLRDLLERITQSGGLTSNSFGNTYVDLDVNADIGSDYDVDSLVNRLKRDILESSNYRNVNALTRGH